MKYIVKGVERKKGSFKRDGENVEYDNVILHCTCAEKNPIFMIGMLCGDRVAEVKMKNDFDNLVYVGEFKGVVNSFADLLDCEIDVAIDPEGKILGLAVLSIGGAV